MERFQDRQVLSKILQESILQMCKVSVGLHNDISIDGIICIATEGEDKELVVKIHEHIQRSTEPESNKLHSTFAAPKVPQNFRCVDDQVFINKIVEPDRTLLHTPASRDYLVCDDTDLFDDLAAIKAILPLNRSDSLDIQTSQAGTVVNLIDDDTVGFSDDHNILVKPTGANDSINVLVKPDPGTDPTCTVASIETSQQHTQMQNCSVTSVTQTRQSFQQAIASSSLLSYPHLKCTPDESSDDDLKIEKLKAGRTRRHKRIPSECRLSPSDLINLDVQPFAVEIQDDASMINVSTSNRTEEQHIAATEKDNGVEIKPIVSRKQTPSLPEPSVTESATINVSTAMPTYTNITPKESPVVELSTAPATYTNITPNDSVAEQDPSPMLSVAIAHSPMAIKTTGLTVAQQLQRIRQQKQQQQQQQQCLIKPQASKMPSPVTPKMPKDDDIPISLSRGQQNYKCPVCGVILTPFKKYHMHMFRLHGAFPCPCCEKMFTHRYSRNRHIVTHHTGSKTFQCPFCGKKYVRADTLKLHMQKQHPHDVDQVKIHYSYAHGKQLYEPDTSTPNIGAASTVVQPSAEAEGGDIVEGGQSTEDNGNIVAIQESNAAESLPSSQVETEVVYNHNLPSKFESVDSENSNSMDCGAGACKSSVVMHDEEEEADSSHARVISSPHHSRADVQVLIHNDDDDARIQYMKLESCDNEDSHNMSHEDVMDMQGIDHEDIMDMIEISDEEFEES